MNEVDILIPTYKRKTGLAIVLTGLLNQTLKNFNIIISDQTAEADSYINDPEIKTCIDALKWYGHNVTIHFRNELNGIIEQRNFLLSKSNSNYIHFIDDDLILKSNVLKRMYDVIKKEKCGFVGCSATRFDFINDERPNQQNIELWRKQVEPELFDFDNIPIYRSRIHRGSNILHIEKRLIKKSSDTLKYKIAWIGNENIIYDRQKLLDIGGFSWWNEVPSTSTGEDALVQFLLIRKYGGCAILPGETFQLNIQSHLKNKNYDLRRDRELYFKLLRKYNIHESQNISKFPKRKKKFNIKTV